MSKAPSVVLAGGGTAGHINPMLAIAREIRRIEPEANILTLGTKDKMEAQLVPEAGFDIEFIPRVAFPRSLSLNALTFLPRFAKAISQTRKILKDANADVVVGVGGYVCPPAYLAAFFSRIPVVIHEANAKPGLANKLGGPLAKFVGVAFSNTPFPRAKLVGMPMKDEIAHLNRRAARAQARHTLGLDPDKPVLIVTGGSLGAQSFNNAVAENITNFEDWGFQVLHITGKGKAIVDDSGEPVTAPNYRQIEFSHGMQDVYAAADLLIVRAGAATVSEVAAVGVPAIFVPLPFGNGEQSLNARSLVMAEAALLIEDKKMTGAWFAREIPSLMADAQKLKEMGRRAYKLGIRDAAHAMAEATLKVVK